MMNNTYYSVKKDLKTALDYIEIFEERMINFISKYPKYSHSVKLNKTKDGEWETEILIRTKDEHKCNYAS